MLSQTLATTHRPLRSRSRLLFTTHPSTQPHHPPPSTTSLYSPFSRFLSLVWWYSYCRLPMDQHLREGALLYFSNSKQWNFGRFLNHLDTLPSFPNDKKLRHELGTELWRSRLLDYARDYSHPENRLKALQELAVSPQPPLSSLHWTHRMPCRLGMSLQREKFSPPTASACCANFAHAPGPTDREDARNKVS